MHTQAVNMLKIDAELRRAIERGEIEVFYQPLVSQINGSLPLHAPPRPSA